MFSRFTPRLHEVVASALVLLIITGANAQQSQYKPPDIQKSFDQTMKESAEARAKIQEATANFRRVGAGSGGLADSRCQSCPGACETVCPANADAKCLGELIQARERAFSVCKSKKQ